MPEHTNGNRFGVQLARPDGAAWTTPLSTGVAVPLPKPPAAETRDQLVASVRNLVAEAHRQDNAGPVTSPQRVESPVRIGQGVRWLIGLASVIGVALLLYGFSGSYTTLFDLAEAHGVPLPELNPIGVDLGLVGVVLMDIVLTLIRMPIAWLRQAARGLALGTIALNAAAGWTATGPDVIAIAQHTYAPVMIVVIVEALRLTLLRKAKRANVDARDPIPIARWLMDPFRTPFMYRRMVLWGQTSYGAAIDLEIERRQAIMSLRAVYGGRAWKREAPADLVWMIKSGVRIADAISRVRDIVDAESREQSDIQRQPDGPSAGTSDMPGSDIRSVRQDVAIGHGQPDTGPDMRRGLRVVRDGVSDQATATESDDARDVSPETGREQDTDTDTEAAALAILAEDPDISGAELGRRLGKTERHGSRLKRALSDSIRAEATGE